MKNKSIDYYLEQIEAALHSDFELLLELGAASYPTDDLIAMYKVWKLKHSGARRFNQHLTRLSVLAVSSFMLAPVFYFFSLSLLAFLTLALAGLSLLLLVAGAFHSNRRYGSRTVLDEAGHYLRAELERRDVLHKITDRLD